MTDYFIGLMSGTSLDGVDVALVKFDAGNIQLAGRHYHPYPQELQNRLHQYCFAKTIPLSALGQLDAELGELYGHCVLELLKQTGIAAKAIIAIGSHGQTLHHNPNTHHRYTLQIGDPNRIAEITGITTVADFRRRDIAAGGQGAPLVPAFHQAIFQSDEENRAVLNLGGIANVTLLPKTASGQPVTGFDTGPGNTLLNAWIARHQGQPYDRNGDWARSGQCHSALLETLLNDPYFHQRPPKSTGPEYFSLSWLEKHLESFPPIPLQDIQATLTHRTATSIRQGFALTGFTPSKILICGGGVHNQYLVALITEQLNCPVSSTEEYGTPPDWVEAMAFAWLARQTLANQPGNLPSVTGARYPVVLGGIYPGLAFLGKS